MIRTKYSRKSVPTPTIGNIGLYFTCYHLSLMGWNVLPTSRNAKGVDIIIYSQNGQRKISIQVKFLSKKNSVPLGNKLDSLISDFVVICIRNSPNNPTCYILKSQEVKNLVHKREKNENISFWLQRPDYEKKNFLENWTEIGQGVP